MEHFVKARNQKGTTNTCMVLAALIAFETVDELHQRNAVNMAMVLHEGKVEWSEVAKWCQIEKGRWAAVYQELMEKAAKRELAIAADKPVKRASGRGK